MNDKEFVDLLVQKGLIKEEDAERILQDAQMADKDVETMLHEYRMVDDDEVAKVKSEHFNIPLKKVNPDEISEEILKFVSPEVSENYHFVPLSSAGGTLVVGMVQPKDVKAQEALRFIGQQHKLNLGVYLISYADFDEVYKKYSPFNSEIEEALKSVEDQSKDSKNLGQASRVVKLEEKDDGVKEAAPIIRLVASALKEAVSTGASDIHVEPQRTKLRVRFRVDGELKEVMSLPLGLHQPVVSRIKVLAKLKIDENRRPQDGRFRTLIFNKEIDFRVSTLPTAVGEKVVLRVLDPTSGLKSVTELGLVGHNLDILKDGLEKPYGMILISGPTGSGKTTSLYSMLQFMNTEDVNIISLEDPVEYTLSGVNQSQMMPEIGYTFASGLRQILRQDPDVIMVGEIRDGETAGLTIQAALTGHRVLSTLHTNNAIGVVPRLIDMGVEPFLLSPALNIMIAQRLVGKMCQDCKKPVETKPEFAKIIAAEMEKLPQSVAPGVSYKPPYQIYEASGCQECKHKGIRGRIAIFEILQMTPEIDTIMYGGVTEKKMMDEAKRQGMLTLRQDGILKVLDGQTSMEEVLRESSESF